MKTVKIVSVLSMSFAMMSVCLATNAQSGGDAIYKTKCQSCHGAAGNPSPVLAKSMNIKAANDPAIKKLTIDQIVATVKSGKNKMKPVGGMNDEQAKLAAAYFKSLGK
jgi:cytochrome c5